MTRKRDLRRSGRSATRQFAAALTAARTRFSLPESEIAALLAASTAD